MKHAPGIDSLCPVHVYRGTHSSSQDGSKTLAKHRQSSFQIFSVLVCIHFQINTTLSVLFTISFCRKYFYCSVKRWFARSPISRKSSSLIAVRWHFWNESQKMKHRNFHTSSLPCFHIPPTCFQLALCCHKFLFCGATNKDRTQNFELCKDWGVGVSARWTSHCFDSFPTAQCSHGSRLSLPEIPLRLIYVCVSPAFSFLLYDLLPSFASSHLHFFFLTIPQNPFYTSPFSYLFEVF